jgi:nucleoside-diphosphate-sugar epimerase
MWVDRIGLLIKSGRLGDLGTLGDGWSNLVHVHDIARAAELSAPSDRSGTEIYNLSAPDSPRWNQYFRDFSLAIGCVPVKYKTSLSMAIESKIIAPPIKIWERLAGKRLLPAPKIQCMPPSLLRLWSQHIKLDSSKASDSLGLNWTSYDDGLAQSAESFRREYG